MNVKPVLSICLDLKIEDEIENNFAAFTSLPAQTGRSRNHFRKLLATISTHIPYTRLNVALNSCNVIICLFNISNN